MPFEDSAQEILARCKDCVPVNTLAGNAIAAHRIAFVRYEYDVADEDARRLADYALRAVIMAVAPSVDESRFKLDYLSELPMNAWEVMEGFSPDWRDETISAMVRNMRDMGPLN